jgi:ribosomal protein S18 acetylase RimI-like enzyme
MDRDLMQKIEEAALNAYPAPRQVVYDGWLLRFTGGDSKRVNSVNVLYPSSLTLNEKIAYCERVYEAQGLPTIFRLPEPFTLPALYPALEQAGFHLYDPTFVLGQAISDAQGEETPEMEFKALGLREWMKVRGFLSGKSDVEMRYLKMVLEIIVPEKVLLAMFVEGHPMACGIGVVEGDLLGYFSIYTHPQARGRGYATAVMLKLREWGAAHGASYGYLQVEGDNLPALGLYEKMGFESCYRYVYSKKEL